VKTARENKIISLINFGSFQNFRSLNSPNYLISGYTIEKEAPINNPKRSMELQKAKLFSLDNNQYDIEFMFNPNELDFKRSIRLNSSPGARTDEGQPKISFAYPEPCVLTISNIIFDTYEKGAAGGDELNNYIQQLTKAVKFVDSLDPPRPPLYIFMWGSNNYLKCFVESFSYKLTMFLPDGKPVRAIVSLTLKEVDETVATGGRTPPGNVNRSGDSRSNRLQ
jgi:hypothetical protein